MKRKLAFLLALLSLANLAACGGSQTGNDTDASGETTAAETSPTVDEYGREIINHSLPDTLDFGGLELNFVSRDVPKYSIDFGVDGANGDVVNDAVYNRNITVEEDLNIKINQLKIADTNTSTSESVGDQLRASVMAGDSVYDIAAVYQYYGASVGTEGLFKNVNKLGYLDFEKPWWNQTFYEEMNYNGKLYIMIGAMNLSVTSSLKGYYFNQKTVTDYHGGYEFLYDLVYDGQWTYDKLTELIKGIYKDLNGDGKKDETDFYGLLAAETEQGPTNAAFDIRLVSKDEKGVPQITFWSERTVDAYDKLYSLYKKTDGVFFEASKDEYEYIKAFGEGRGLFACCGLESSEMHFRDMKDTYGILPMPKYDEAQEDYYNAARDTSNLMGIVVTCKNTDAATAALELMNYYSYRDIVPAYFEVAMKSKYLADSDSANMFDIIVENVKVDFGEIYSFTIGGSKYTMEGAFAVKFRNMIRQNVENIASNWAQFEPSYKENLAKLVAQLDELE